MPSAFISNDNVPSRIYTLYLHYALPIYDLLLQRHGGGGDDQGLVQGLGHRDGGQGIGDRKSTRLNSSHVAISYAVFCLKKKNDMDDMMYTSTSVIVNSINN